MIFTQTGARRTAGRQHACFAAKPDALLTSIVDNKALDDIIKEARDAGVIVVAVNVDDTEGAKGNARQAFIGQGFVPAGYSLGKAVSDSFPATGPIKVLVGISAPGQNWSESRGAGVMKFLEEYKAAHADRAVSWERIDSGTDLATSTASAPTSTPTPTDRLFRHRLLVRRRGAGTCRPRRRAGLSAV